MSAIDKDLPVTALHFQNELLTDFSLPGARRAFEQALASVQRDAGREYRSTSRRADESAIVSVNPARPSEIVGTHYGSVEAAKEAIQRATDEFPAWSRMPLDVRTSVLRRTADALRERRHEFSAWLLLEAGKNWAEADADTAEAVDFLEFYAGQMEQLAQAEPAVQIPGEVDRLAYIPLGVGIVLSPWNFPLAIMAGMTCAAIVAGNTVVLKPSPLAPTIAQKFVELLQKCGLPENVVNLVQGGAQVGAALVEDPRVRFIAFTGSKATGLEIHRVAAQPQKGQPWIKRTILEMGGKDAIVVDRDADPDFAAQGIVASAFGFSGQKCSACSRLIVHADIYSSVLDAVVERTRKLTWGDPAENPNMGPVIDRAAFDRIRRYQEMAPKQGRVLAGGDALTSPEDGFFIAPTVVADVDPMSPLAQEEIFGPVLAAIPAMSFDHALQIANNTEYGLTGAVYSNDEKHLERAEREFHVGNLYLNRKCTGAMVGAHPFGGFNMSGTDTKAGGKEYLLHFTQAKSIARKLI